MFTLVVAHRAHTSDSRTDNDSIARVKRTVLDEDGRNRSAAAVELRLNDDTFGAAVRICLKFLHFRDKQDHFKKFRNSLFGERGNGNAYRIAAPFLRHEVIFRQLLLDCFRIGAGLVDLVDCHNDGNAGRFRVIDRLHRLRHDAVVGGDDKNRDIRRLRAPRAHGGKRFVSRRVEECDILSVAVHAVCADMLGDAACLACRHMRIADGVEQRGFTVIDMSHHADDGRTGDKRRGTVVGFVEKPLLDGDDDLLCHLCAELIGHKIGRIVIDYLIDGRHDAHHHESLYDLARSYF